MKLSTLIPLAALLFTETTMVSAKISDNIREFFSLPNALAATAYKKAPFDNLRSIKANLKAIINQVSQPRHVWYLMSSYPVSRANEQDHWAQWLTGKQLQHLVEARGADVDVIGYMIPYLKGKVLSQLNISEANFATILSRDIAKFKPFQINSMSKKFLQKHGKALVESFATQVGGIAKGPELSRLDEKTLIAMLHKKGAVTALTEGQALSLLTRRKFAKLLGPKFMKRVALLNVDPGKNAIFVRDLPEKAFAEIKQEVHENWFRYMTEAQMRNFQSKSLKKGATCRLKLSSVGAQAIPGLWPKLMSKFFHDHPDDIAVKSNRLWKRIPIDVFQKLCKKDQFPVRMPKKAFKYMTLQQRQVFLDSMGKEETCANLRSEIFEGRSKYWLGLKVSKKCFQSMNENEDKAQMRFRVIASGLVEPDAVKEVETSEIKKWRFVLRRPGKKGSKSKETLRGVVAMEALSRNPRGAEYIKAVLKDDADEKCKTIEIEELKYATWLQDQLPRDCIRHIKGLDSDVGAKMSSNIWASLKWKQLKQIHSGEFSDLGDNAYKGLSKSQDFAEHACKSKAIKDKKQKDGKAYTKCLLQKLNADKVRATFTSTFINLVPEADRECLARQMGLFNGQILTDVEASLVAALVKGGKVTGEQLGHASDNVEESKSYPASLTGLDVAKFTADQVGHFSATFLGKMKPAAIGALSEAQVQAIPSANLTKICGDKAAAFKHLSEDQKAHLSRDCPAAPVKEPGLAPCPHSASSILAIAAAAAGGAAILL